MEFIVVRFASKENKIHVEAQSRLFVYYEDPIFRDSAVAVGDILISDYE